MPTPTKGPRLGGSPSHERLMLANLATSLFEHGRITTTETKATRLRPVAEKLITLAKRGDLHARRLVMTQIRDKDVVHHLFAEIGPRYENRPGGYTRITKVGNRKGDNAPMAQIEILTETVEDGRKNRAKVAAPAPAARKSAERGGAQKAAAPAAGGADEQVAPEAPVEETPAEELVTETNERDEATSAQEQPSDDVNAEEAASAETSTEGEQKA